MARRLPGIRQRMEDVALDLFERQGLATTTAREIAEAAGTTERTFFRHFRDKVDVAFGDETRLMQLAAAAVLEAPATASAWDAVVAGLEATADQFDQRRTAILRRARVVNANPALLERELSRTTAWTDMFVAALGQRGAQELTATVCAATGLALFRVALAGWADQHGGSFRAHLHDVLADLHRELASSSISTARPNPAGTPASG